MKIYSMKLLFLFCLSACLAFQVVEAQTKKKVTTKKPAPKTTATKTASNTQVLDAAVTPKQADTAKPVPAPPAKISILTDTVRKSRRNNSSIDEQNVKTRTILWNEHIREDDALYRQFVWREIDVYEKMNLPFRYKASNDNGNQQFINILLRAIDKGDITAFDASFNDDRFTKEMTVEEIRNKIFGKTNVGGIPDSIDVPDFDNGKNGSTTKKIPAPPKEFNPDSVKKFRIKEEWVFDKESSRMMTRILGIAPIFPKTDKQGNIVGTTPVFWLYYQDLRPLFAQTKIYTGKNFGTGETWEDLFENRYFASTIVKSSIDNPYDLYISDVFKDSIMRLLEGENIKNKIFNFELDLWSF